MKIKDGLVFTEVGEDLVAVPVGAAADDFHGVVRLNETGGYILRALADGLDARQVEERLMAEYDNVDAETAQRAVAYIVDKLKADGLLEGMQP